MDTKYCKYCNTTKLINEFHNNKAKKDGLADRCKQCRKKYHKKHYEANKTTYMNKAAAYKKSNQQWLNEIKQDFSCSECSENRWWVLDFHHRDSSQKDKNLADVLYWSKKKIQEELIKCDVLCSNCHRNLHHKQRQAV